MFEGCQEDVWRVSGGCLKGVWRVSGRCLEGPDWTGFAPFGPERYLVVFEYCLDRVWRVSGKYL